MENSCTVVPAFQEETVNCEIYRTLREEKNFIVGPVVLEHVNCEKTWNISGRKIYFLFARNGVRCK